MDAINAKLSLVDEGTKFEASFKDVMREDAVIGEQEICLAELVESSRALQTAEQMKQMKALSET